MNEVTLREAPLRFSSSLAEGDPERERDTLKLIPYAEALRDFIHDCETPTTVGIQGEWGVGRTSLMNMLRGDGRGGQGGLLDARRCKVIGFDCWPYAQFERFDHLAATCFSTLCGILGKLLEEEPAIDAGALKEALEAVGDRLERVMRQLRELRHGGGGQQTPAATHIDISGQMLAFRSEFQHLVALWTGTGAGRRVVIFVDDLDRVRPVRALELLEAIENFIDVGGCVFVMALDYDCVQQGIREKLGAGLQRARGKAFFDKLVQLPFVVPTKSYRLDDYIFDLLGKAGLDRAADLRDGRDTRRFFLDITRCTVGRNPRSIKQVINYTKLLEQIHRHNSGRPTSAHEYKILYALTAMQVAWPELFQHLVRDPSVDAITSLQSWEYLDQLPQAVCAFERAPDPERVKCSISAFFDTLFSLLDENDDGQIDTRELQPVLQVMERAKITSAENIGRSKQWFIRRVRENNLDKNPLIDSFLDNVFTKSVWYLGSELKFRKAGNRYVTLVHNRRQIGTLVSLRSDPLVFRLAASPEQIMTGLKTYWNNKRSVKQEAISLVRNTFDSEASLTGFGDTLVDFSKLTYMPSTDAVSLLNALYRIITENG